MCFWIKARTRGGEVCVVGQRPKLGVGREVCVVGLRPTLGCRKM